MTLSNGLSVFSSLVVAGTFSGCVQHESSDTPSGRSDQRPNVLLILADDQRADALGCAGNTFIRTPNIDSLAENGLRFTNAYVMGGHHGAISAPSRAMLLSGKHLFNVYDRLNGVTTMPMQFGADGYVTYGTGKWHNEKSAFEASFKNAGNVFLGGMANHFSIPVRDMMPNGHLSEPVEKSYSIDLFASSAIGFLDKYAAGNKEDPFFCYVAFTVPHDPYSPRTDFIGLYPDQTLPLPPNFMPLHPFRFDDLTVRDENLLAWPREPEKVRSLLSDYYALITHLDKSVGEIIQTLKRNGLYDNTIIIYAADNGLAAGSHGLLGKQSLYEHSMKVPLIISGPGIPKDRVTDALVYLFDIYPTLAQLCNVPVSPGTDGKSLMSVLNNNEKVRESLFTAYRNTVRAVRNEEWKLIRYPEINYSQLYNLRNDPFELNNLAESSEHEGKLIELEELMKTWQSELGDTVSLSADVPEPMEYDHRKLVRKPDHWQPAYTLEKYFGIKK